MSETSNLLTTVKKCLRAKGLSYKDVAGALAVSEASVKRIFAEENFSLKRLEAVCWLLDMSLYDLVRLSRLGEENEVSVLSLEQEAALAQDSMLLTVFYLLLNGWSPVRIAREYGLTKIGLIRLLATLDRLKLIELLPQNRVRPLTARNIAWRRDGPVRKLYERQVKAEFLSGDFERPGERLSLETGELSEASIRILERKIDRLRKDFDELADIDLSLPPQQKRSVGLMVAFRLWVFSLLAAHKNTHTR